MNRFVLPLTLTACLSGCSSDPAPQPRGTAAPRAVRIDGLAGDWDALPGDEPVAHADEDFLYLRFKVGDAPVSLQSGVETFSLWLDADADARTGRRASSPNPAASLGIDLEVRFSPASEGRVRSGASVLCYDESGHPRAASPYDLDVIAAPTFASDWFEVRLSRHLDSIAGLPVPGVRSEGSASGLYVLSNASGDLTGWSDTPFTLELPRRASAPPLAAARLPACPADAVRIVSWNVKRTAPAAARRPFAAALQALDPDIVLVQEWDAPAEEIRAWFTALMGDPNATWQVQTSAGLGVAIVSRHPIAPLGPERLVLADEAGPRAPDAIRFVGGLVNTPSGDVAVGSVHLKCCGSDVSAEELTRRDQALAIREALTEAWSEAPTTLRLIAGDFNLVGTSVPLEVLARGLDADASDLTPVDLGVLGESIGATWSDPASPFPPGRLDWALAGDARARVANAFVLDTTRLDDASLASMGLAREDSLASDHRPLVIDLAPIR